MTIGRKRLGVAFLFPERSSTGAMGPLQAGPCPIIDNTRANKFAHATRESQHAAFACWKRHWPAGVLAVVAITGAGLAPAEPPAGDVQPQPRIHVETGLIDLGRVPEGRIGEVIFAVENRGSARLEILEAKTTCTCIHFEIPRRVLAPGERIFIPARYVTTGHAGRESGAITLTTNDPQTPRTQLVIAVDIESIYEIEPLGSLRLQPQRPGLPCEPELKLLPKVESVPLRVLSVEMQSGKFEVRRAPYERDGRVGEKLTFVGLGDAKRGTLRDAMILALKVGDQEKRVRIPVLLPLLGELRVEPKVMARVNPTWRGRQIGKITVESVLGRAVQVLSATAPGALIDVEVQPVEPQRKYEIPVRVAADAPPGPFGCMVTVVTDHPGESLVFVPVYGNVHPWVWVLPRAVLLKIGAASPPASQADVRLMWPVDAPVKLSDPRCDDARLTAELIPGPNETRDGLQLATATLRIKPTENEERNVGSEDPTYGNFRTTIRLTTGWDKQPAIEVPVFVRAECPRTGLGVRTEEPNRRIR